MLKGNVEIEFKSLVFEIADQYGLKVVHMEIGKDDHVYLLVTVSPKLSVTNIVRWLKGISAYRLFRRCPELKTSYWKAKGRHL